MTDSQRLASIKKETGVYCDDNGMVQISLDSHFIRDEGKAVFNEIAALRSSAAAAEQRAVAAEDALADAKELADAAKELAIENDAALKERVKLRARIAQNEADNLTLAEGWAAVKLEVCVLRADNARLRTLTREAYEEGWNDGFFAPKDTAWDEPRYWHLSDSKAALTAREGER